MIKLETKTIKLRAVEPSDANLIYEWENDTTMWDVSGIITPYSMFQIEQYVTSEPDIYQSKQMRLIIDLKGENQGEYISIGTIDLFDFDPLNKRAGVGVLIYPQELRQKGYATEALSLIKEYAANVLDMHQLHCTVSVDNKASLGCMKKAGFEESGVQKDWNKVGAVWFDVVFLQCFLHI